MSFGELSSPEIGVRICIIKIMNKVVILVITE